MRTASVGFRTDVIVSHQMVPHITSLSSQDASVSYGLLVAFLKHHVAGEFVGKTYSVGLVEITLPRFAMKWMIGDDYKRPLTLSERFTRQFAPTVAEAGGGYGFSAVAEAWLNFGHIGPLLVGCLFGWGAAMLSRTRSPVVHCLLALVILRYFRSDFASLWKSYVVILGGGAVFWIAVGLCMRGKGRGNLRAVSRRKG